MTCFRRRGLLEAILLFNSKRNCYVGTRTAELIKMREKFAIDLPFVDVFRLLEPAIGLTIVSSKELSLSVIFKGRFHDRLSYWEAFSLLRGRG